MSVLAKASLTGRSFFPMIMMILLATGCNTAGPDPRQMADVPDIYLLIGQSNMAGRAEIRKADRDSLSGVYLMTNDTLRLWEPAANPLNKYSTIRKKIDMQQLGPGYSFARQMRSYDPEKDIYLVVNARGGTSILEWMPGKAYYDEAVSRTTKAMESGQLKGILWYQGSSDVSRTDIYLDSLIQMIKGFREDFKLGDLPFIACELSEDKPARIPFNNLLRTLPEHLENTAVINAAGTTTFDSTHFDSGSQLLLGERFAEQMHRMVKQ